MPALHWLRSLLIRLAHTHTASFGDPREQKLATSRRFGDASTVSVHLVMKYSIWRCSMFGYTFWFFSSHFPWSFLPKHLQSHPHIVRNTPIMTPANFLRKQLIGLFIDWRLSDWCDWLVYSSTGSNNEVDWWCFESSSGSHLRSGFATLLSGCDPLTMVMHFEQDWTCLPGGRATRYCRCFGEKLYLVALGRGVVAKVQHC